MSRSSRLAPLIARCSTALLVVIGLVGLALDFYVSVVTPHTWWLHLPGAFLGLFLFIMCGMAVRRRLADNQSGTR